MDTTDPALSTLFAKMLKQINLQGAFIYFVLDYIKWKCLYLRFHRSKGTTKREGGKIKSDKKSGFPPSLMVFPLHSLSFT